MLLISILVKSEFTTTSPLLVALWDLIDSGDWSTLVHCTNGPHPLSSCRRPKVGAWVLRAGGVC